MIGKPSGVGVALARPHLAWPGLLGPEKQTFWKMNSGAHWEWPAGGLKNPIFAKLIQVPTGNGLLGGLAWPGLACVAAPGLFPSHCVAISGSIPSHCMAMPGLIPSHCVAISGLIPSHCVAMPGLIPSHCMAVPGLIPSHCMAISGLFLPHSSLRQFCKLSSSCPPAWRTQGLFCWP